MNRPDAESIVTNGTPVEQQPVHSRAAAILIGVAVGFFYAMFCFAFGFFGVGVVGALLLLLAGAFASGVLGRFAGPKWTASALAQCAGTAPYTLLFLIGGGLFMGDRLSNLLFMLGPAVIGTFLGAKSRHHRRAA